MAKKKQDYTMSLNEKIDMLRMGVRAVTRGYKNSRLITGVPGIGKSFAVLDELRIEEANYIHITGGIKDAKAFYITLYKHNSSDIIIVLDDVNDLIRKRQNVEILRAAVSNDEERIITFADQNMFLMEGYKSYQPKMKFKSKVIIITNIPKTKLDPAIVSRTSPIEIIVDKYEIAPFIEANLAEAPPTNVPIEWKHEAWNYITKELGLNNIKRLDFRVFEDVMLWLRATKDPDSQTKDWKKMAYSVLT